jgi:hypothetical protein
MINDIDSLKSSIEFQPPSEIDFLDPIDDFHQMLRDEVFKFYFQ